MELDSGDEDLQNFLNNQYFMMQQMLPTPASPIDVTNDSPIQGCAPPAGSRSVRFEVDRSSDSEDSDSDSTCSDHSSCKYLAVATQTRLLKLRAYALYMCHIIVVLPMWSSSAT